MWHTPGPEGQRDGVVCSQGLLGFHLVPLLFHQIPCDSAFLLLVASLSLFREKRMEWSFRSDCQAVQLLIFYLKVAELGAGTWG